MRRLFILPLLFLAAFSMPADTLTEKERKFATDHLAATRDDFFKTLSGLSEAQLKFKAAPDKWSVEDCAKHIAVAEKGIWSSIEAGMKQPVNPEKRAEIKMNDEQLLKAIQDRSAKFKAPEQIQPQNSGFANVQDALASFKATREQIIQYISTTQDDMRNHVLSFPVGVMDAYQMVLLISAHSNRHTQQMKEVMADPNFPKN
jgi:uncharacterized damage-inducible protein DinB